MTDSGRIGGGFDNLYYGILDSDGFLIGNTAIGVAAGAVQGMKRLYGAKTAPIAIKEPDVVTATGDNNALVQFQFLPAELPDGVITMAQRDLDFEALIQGTSTYVLGSTKLGVRQPGNNNPPNMCLLLTRRAKTWGPNSKGVAAFDVELINSCSITPLGAQWTERAIEPYSYKVTINEADHFIWGETIASTNLGTNAGAIIPIDSDNPLHIAAAKGDGATVAFTLPYTPVSSSRILVEVERVAKTLTTHYTVAGKVVTFLSAPANGARIVFYYETTETEMV